MTPSANQSFMPAPTWSAGPSRPLFAREAVWRVMPPARAERAATLIRLDRATALDARLPDLAANPTLLDHALAEAERDGLEALVRSDERLPIDGVVQLSLDSFVSVAFIRFERRCIVERVRVLCSVPIAELRGKPDDFGYLLTDFEKRGIPVGVHDATLDDLADEALPFARLKLVSVELRAGDPAMDERARTRVSSSLLHVGRLKTAIRGVDTPQQLSFVQGLGCVLMSGRAVSPN